MRFTVVAVVIVLVCSYRLMAVDHDLFSFVDVKLNTWPVVLVTNPKDAHYVMKAHEPLGRMRRSTHIRCGENVAHCVCWVDFELAYCESLPAISINAESFYSHGVTMKTRTLAQP